MSRPRWEYGGYYRSIAMDGPIALPNQSMVQACDWIDEMPAFMRRADVLFIDPPWNMGNAKSFYTKANVPHPPLSFSQFSEKLFGRIETINPDTLFLEIGKDALAQYLTACQQRFRHVTFYNATYYRKPRNKCYVIHATHDTRMTRYRHLEDADEEDIIAEICRRHPYDCIGDLCMGLGLVGRYAYLASRSFVGTELNPKRLANLVAFIQRQESHAACATLG